MHRQWCLRPSPQPSPRSHGEREFVECDASAMVLAPLTPTLSPLHGERVFGTSPGLSVAGFSLPSPQSGLEARHFF